MFPEGWRSHRLSLMPVSHLMQNQVGIVTWIIDVVKNRCPAQLAGIVDHNIPKAEQPLPDRG